MIQNQKEQFFVAEGRVLLKKGANIDWKELSSEELLQYRKAGRKSLLLGLAVFCAFLPAMIVFSVEIIKKVPAASAGVILAFAVYIFACFGDYAMYFAGRPRGIRYGRVSRKISRNRGRYWGYVYNVYFEDIHKSVTNVMIRHTKSHPVIMKGDRVMVIRSRLGGLYIVFTERENTDGESVSEEKK